MKTKIKLFLGALIWMFFAAACGLSTPTPSQPQVVTVIVTAESPPTATAAPSPSPLPSATIGPPAPTATLSAPKLTNKPPDGPQSSDIAIEVIMDPSYLMQVQTRIKGNPNNGDGIGQVTFLIERYGEFVYQETETLATYCIFKGGEPDCNPWPQTNGRFTWGAGGPEVETGDYEATIRVWSLADPNHSLKWTFDFTIDLP